MEPPLFPPSGQQTVRAAPGSPASLVLPLPAGTPPFHYTWSRAGASLDERFTSADDATGVRLTVSAARTGDTDVYTLQASNAAGTDTARVRLEVPSDEASTGEDPPTFLRRLQDLTVKVGTRTRFLVEIVSSTECKVTWYRNERRLLEAERVSLARDGNFWCADVAAVSVDDAGRWTCTAENAGGRASCSAHLNVLVPKAYKRPEFVEELRALLTEQGTVSLECKVVGVPTPVLRWFKDSREIKAGDVFALTANAEDPTSLGTYTCEAVNCMGRAYSSSKVHVVGRGSREGSTRPSSSLAPEPPPIFTKELEDQFVRITEPLTLGCHIVVPPWPRSVVWYNKEGKVEPGERYHVLEDGAGGYLLEIPSAEWPDEGEWKCVACSSGGRVGISTCYVTMDVPKNYRKPRFMENLQAVLTEEGLVSFECKVVGFPTPVLSWFKDGQELKPGDVYQLTGTNSLGSYCCIARNCMGQASSSAELTVEDIQNQLNEEEKHQLFQAKNQAPKFIQGLKSVEAKIDEPFRFTVKVAIPPEPSVLWYRDDQPVDESSRCHHGKEDRGVFYLDIQTLEFLDQAEWKCVAMNDFGHSVTSCFLKLIIPRHYKKPRFLENLQAILSDEGAVNLECKVIGVPQPVLKWYKDGEELKPGDIHRIISGQDGTCCLGTYTCEAQNCMGIAASSASLLGFDDSMKAKKKKAEEQALQRNLSLSTIHEERTSQMYDTPVGDITLNDDKGEISFSFDGKEVSVSLYETPDLTEEEALQIVEMYADQLSENITEHNVVELPPLRFVKETSTSGNLLMEAVIIDVSPDYFQSPDEDLRTEADVEDISIADENAASLLSLEQDDIGGEDYLEKTMALLSEEKSDIPMKSSRKKSDSQRSADDFFSLSRDQSLSEEKRDDDTQPISESDMPSFASAHSSGKPKSKSSKPSGEDGQESSEPTKTILLKEEAKKQLLEVEPVVKPKRERRTSRGSRRSSSGSEKSVSKSREAALRKLESIEIETPKKPQITDEEFKQKMASVSTSLSKVINDVQIIERDIILKSELMSSAATASRSLEIISSLITPLSEIHSIADAAKEAVTESKEVSSTLFNSLPQPLKALQQSLTIIEKCIDMESDSKTLVKKTCVAFIETCGSELQHLISEVNAVTSKDYLTTEDKVLTEIESLNNEMSTVIKFSADTIKARNLISEASDIKVEEPTQEVKHLRETQKAVFELKTPLNSLLSIAESADSGKIVDVAKVTNSEVLLNDMSGSIQDLQTALEQIESLSVKEATSSLQKYNTEFIETVMESVVKLRTSFEQLSTEARSEDKTVLKQAITSIKENLNKISSQIDSTEHTVGTFDVLASDNKLDALQKMAQILITLENSLPRLEPMPEVKSHMTAFHKDLTKVLENVIESNESKKYFALMEICDGVNRINSSIKNLDVEPVMPLASLNNTMHIIQDQFVKNVFDSELNCSVLSNITDTLVGIQEALNNAEEISMHIDSEHLQDITPKAYDETKAKVIVEHIDHTIAAIENVKAVESVQELKSNITPTLEKICPVLVELKRSVAAIKASGVDEEHISEISDASSVAKTLATPLCELNQNILVLNQQIVENIETMKDSSEIMATVAEPLHELHTTLEILQQEVISQYGEDVTPYDVSLNMANAVQNLQSCIVMIQEQAGVEGADEMSTLEDISGIKTTADTLPSDRLVLPTAEETAIEQALSPFDQEQQPTITAQALQSLNEHITILQTPEIIDALDTLSEVSDYSSLKSFVVGLGELHNGIEEIFHPILMEGSNEIINLINPAKLTAIAEPMQELQQSLSVLDTSNIPIYENILEIPTEKIHSVIQSVSEFKEHLDKCMLAVFPAMQTADTTVEIANKVGALREVCEHLKDIIDTTKTVESMPVPEEVKALEVTVDNLLDATDVSKGIKIDQVKTITEELYEKVINVQEEMIQFTPQPLEKLAQEAKLIQTIDEVQNNIAVLEQYDFVDLSRASDMSCTSPQLAIELQSDSLVQIGDIVDSAVNIIQDSAQDTPLADLMIVEDFFKTCKNEFTILRCLTSKATSHKKIIRLLQEFSSLQSTVNDFKVKRSELKLSNDVNDCLDTFIIHADNCLRSVQVSLAKIVDSQANLLIETPLAKLENSTKALKEVSVTKQEVQVQQTVKKFTEILEIAKPALQNVQSDILEELTSTTPVKEDNILADKLEEFATFVEQSKTQAKDSTAKEILEKVSTCIEKHQDYKDATGTGKSLIIMKCLSDCTDILQENLLAVKTTKPKVEEGALKEVLTEMLEPLQALHTQLTNVQEQVLRGVDEDSISLDITTTESLVQTMTEKHKQIVEKIESEVVVANEEISLIMEVDKEIHSIQDSLKSIESTQVAQVVKEIAKPVQEIEKSLQNILSSEKVAEEKLPTDVNSNIDSLEDALERFLNIGFDSLVDLSIFKDINIPQSIEIAMELKYLLALTPEDQSTPKIMEKKNNNIKYLKEILTKFDWLNTDAYEGKTQVESEKLKSVFLATYQLLAELDKVDNLHVELKEEKAKQIIQHIDQYIELIEIVEEISAIIRIEDVKETMDIAKELRESIAASEAVVESDVSLEQTVETRQEQARLAHKLQTALSALQVQVLEGAQELAPELSAEVLQRIAKVTAQLQADLVAVTGVRVAVQAPSEPITETTETLEPVEKQTTSITTPESAPVATETEMTVLEQEGIVEVPFLAGQLIATTEMLEKMIAESKEVVASTDVELVSSEMLKESEAGPSEVVAIESTEPVLVEQISSIPVEAAQKEVEVGVSEPLEVAIKEQVTTEGEVVPFEETISTEPQTSIEKGELTEIAEEAAKVSIDTLVQHIDQYISDDIAEVINDLCDIVNAEELKQSINIAKELRESIEVSEVQLKAETSDVLKKEVEIQQAELAQQLHIALAAFKDMPLDALEEITSINRDSLEKVAEITKNLRGDLAVVIAKPDIIDQTVEEQFDQLVQETAEIKATELEEAVPTEVAEQKDTIESETVSAKDSIIEIQESIVGETQTTAESVAVQEEIISVVETAETSLEAQETPAIVLTEQLAVSQDSEQISLEQVVVSDKEETTAAKALEQIEEPLVKAPIETLIQNINELLSDNVLQTVEQISATLKVDELYQTIGAAQELLENITGNELTASEIALDVKPVSEQVQQQVGKLQNALSVVQVLVADNVSNLTPVVGEEALQQVTDVVEKLSSGLAVVSSQASQQILIGEPEKQQDIQIVQDVSKETVDEKQTSITEKQHEVVVDSVTSEQLSTDIITAQEKLESTEQETKTPEVVEVQAAATDDSKDKETPIESVEAAKYSELATKSEPKSIEPSSSDTKESTDSTEKPIIQLASELASETQLSTAVEVVSETDIAVSMDQEKVSSTAEQMLAVGAETTTDIRTEAAKMIEQETLTPETVTEQVLGTDTITSTVVTAEEVVIPLDQGDISQDKAVVEQTPEDANKVVSVIDNAQTLVEDVSDLKTEQIGQSLVSSIVESTDDSNNTLKAEETQISVTEPEKLLEDNSQSSEQPVTETTTTSIDASTPTITKESKTLDQEHPQANEDVPSITEVAQDVKSEAVVDEQKALETAVVSTLEDASELKQEILASDIASTEVTATEAVQITPVVISEDSKPLEHTESAQKQADQTVSEGVQAAVVVSTEETALIEQNLSESDKAIASQILQEQLDTKAVAPVESTEILAIKDTVTDTAIVEQVPESSIETTSIVVSEETKPLELELLDSKPAEIEQSLVEGVSVTTVSVSEELAPITLETSTLEIAKDQIVLTEGIETAGTKTVEESIPLEEQISKEDAAITETITDTAEQSVAVTETNLIVQETVDSNLTQKPEDIPEKESQSIVTEHQEPMPNEQVIVSESVILTDNEKAIEEILSKDVTEQADSSKTVIEQGGLIEHIGEFISDEITELVENISVKTHSEELKETVELAKVLKESIEFAGTEEASSIEGAKTEQAALAQKLQDALSVLHSKALESADELAIKPETLQKVSEVITDLQKDLETAIVSGIPQVLKSAEIVELQEFEENSMKQLEVLLQEVTDKINVATVRDADDTESLKDALDEVQTVIIKLKCDYDGAANDTLNETLEDLECSVRSVQLQINEDSPPELLKEACATLQLLVNNMNETQEVRATEVKAVEVSNETILEKCSAEADETVKLLQLASQIKVKDGDISGILTGLTTLTDTIKSLKLSFTGNADVLIEKGVDITQNLDLLEDKVFSLEKELTEASMNVDTRDSILTAIHSVYGSISNMRGTISSVQKRYMFENYGKPSEILLRSIKNVSSISEVDESEKQNWKTFSKSLRKVLNHFEDIKFYINLDKTARLPGDAAFTKIILEELKSNIGEVLVPQASLLGVEATIKVNHLLECVNKNLFSIESSVTLEVKKKIPIFKELSSQILSVTEFIKSEKDKQTKDIPSQEIQITEDVESAALQQATVETASTEAQKAELLETETASQQIAQEEATTEAPKDTSKPKKKSVKLVEFKAEEESTQEAPGTSGVQEEVEQSHKKVLIQEPSVETQIEQIASDLVSEIALEAISAIQGMGELDTFTRQEPEQEEIVQTESVQQVEEVLLPESKEDTKEVKETPSKSDEEASTSAIASEKEQITTQESTEESQSPKLQESTSEEVAEAKAEEKVEKKKKSKKVKVEDAADVAEKVEEKETGDKQEPSTPSTSKSDDKDVVVAKSEELLSQEKEPEVLKQESEEVVTAQQKEDELFKVVDKSAVKDGAEALLFQETEQREREKEETTTAVSQESKQEDISKPEDQVAAQDQKPKEDQPVEEKATTTKEPNESGKEKKDKKLKKKQKEEAKVEDETKAIDEKQELPGTSGISKDDVKEKEQSEITPTDISQEKDDKEAAVTVEQETSQEIQDVHKKIDDKADKLGEIETKEKKAAKKLSQEESKEEQVVTEPVVKQAIEEETSAKEEKEDKPEEKKKTKKSETKEKKAKQDAEVQEITEKQEPETKPEKVEQKHASKKETQATDDTIKQDEKPKKSKKKAEPVSEDVKKEEDIEEMQSETKAEKKESDLEEEKRQASQVEDKVQKQQETKDKVEAVAEVKEERELVVEKISEEKAEGTLQKEEKTSEIKSKKEKKDDETKPTEELQETVAEAKKDKAETKLKDTEESETKAKKTAESKIKKEQEETEAKAKKEKEEAEDEAKKEKEEAETMAKKDIEKKDAKVKKEKSEAETKAEQEREKAETAQKEEVEAKQKKEREDFETKGKKEQDDHEAKAKEEIEDAEVKAKKEQEESEAKAKKEKEEAEAKAKKEEGEAEAMVKREKEEAEAKAKKEQDESEAKAKKEKEEAVSKAKKDKKEAEKKAKKEKEEAEAKAIKDKEEAEAKAKKEQEDSEAKTNKEKEKAEAKAKKEKEEEEAKVREEKEQGEAKAEKEKENTEAKVKKEKEEAEAKVKKEKEEAEASTKKEKEDAEAKARKEKEEAEATAKKEKKDAEAKAKAIKEKEDAEAKARKEKEEAEAKAKTEKEEAEAKAKAKKEEAEAKAKKEKEEAEAMAKKEKEDAEAKAKKEKEEAEAKAIKEKEEAEAKAKKEKKDAEAKARKEKEEAEAKAKKEKEEAEATAKKEKEEAEAKAKAKKAKEDADAKAKKEKEEAEAKAKKEKEDAEAKARKEKEEAEVKARKEKEEAEAKAKKEKEEAEAKAKKEKEEAEAKAKKEKEDAEAKAKEEAEAKAKKEKEEAEAKAKKEKEEAEAKAKKEKEEAEAKAKKEKEEAEAKARKEKDEAEANAKKEKEDAEAKAKKDKKKAEAKAKKEKEEAEAKAQKEMEEAEAKAKKQKEEADAKTKKEKEEADILAKKEKQEAEAKAKKEKEEAEAKIKKEKEETEAKAKQEQKDAEAKAKREKEEAEAKVKAKKEQEEAEAKAMKEKKEAEEKARKEKEEAEAQVEREREQAKAEKKKAEAEAKEKDAEAKAKKEKVEAEAKAKKEKEEAEAKAMKEKEEAEARAKKEKDEAEARVKKEKEDAEAKAEKEKKEKIKKAEAEAREKEEAENKAKKEKEEAEAKAKKVKETEAKAKKEKEEAEAKVKKEKEEADAKAKKEKEEAEAKAKKEKEDAEAQAEKKKKETKEKKKKAEAEAKEKEEAEAKKKKEKEEVEAKKVKETEAKAKKEKEEAEAKAKKEKEEAEAKAKKEKEEADVKAQKKKEEAEAKAKKEKEEADNKAKKDKEKIEAKAKKEKEDAEAKVKKDKDAAKAKTKKDTDEKIKKEVEQTDTVEAKEESNLKKPHVEKKAIQEDGKLDNDKQERKKSADDGKLKKRLSKKKSKDDTESGFKTEAQSDVSKKEIERTVETERTETVRKDRHRETETDTYESRKKVQASYEPTDKHKAGENGDVEHKSERDDHYIREYQYEPSRQKTEERTKFVDHNHRDYTMEFLRPSGYREKAFEHEKYTERDSRSLGKNATIYKAQTIVLDSQLRSSMPPQSDRTESEKRIDRHRSKALSEVRSLISEKRSGMSRDHKRKPVFSTYLTDRTAVEGSRVKLTCSVLSSTDPKITWYKNGVVLDNKLKYRTKFIDGLITLEVLNAVPGDSAEYSCTVENENGSVNTSANLKVYPSFEASPIPPTFTRSIRDTYHLAENELILECRIRGQPLPTITWLKDEKPVSSNERFQAYYLADGVCRLAISHPTSEDSGKYTCKAENSVWSDQITHVVSFTGKESRLSPNLATIERSRFNRQALESRRPYFTNVLSDYKVTKGGTIGLQVEIRGCPTRVEWLREGHNVTEVYRNAKTFVEHGLYTLALTDVTEKESGMYTCRAWSTHGNVDMNAAITVVPPNELEGKPAIIVGRPDKDILISVGEDVNISFRVQGEPKPKVVFMKGIRDITNSQRACKMTSDDYVKFTLKRSVVSDAGTYCILARNAYGCDRAFVTVVVRQRASSENLISDWTYPMDDSASSTAERKYKSVPERIPGEPSVVDGGNNWVSLAWPKSDPGETAPVLAYKIESWLLGKEGGARWIELGITPLNSFDAFNLKQGEEYHFRVTPRNRYGWGESVQTSSPVGIGLAGDRPEFVDILPGQLKVLAGETANLSCNVKGKPLPEVVWMKNGHEIEDEGRITTQFNGHNCSLTIKDINIEDEARYSCEASNVHGRASTYARLAVVTDRLIWEADAKLKRDRSQDVVGEFAPQFTMRLRDRRVQATYPVRLTCQVVGNPPPTLTWFKDGEDVAFDSRRCKYQDEHFHTLEIAPTTLEDGGVYEAMARNSSGAVSCRCSLVVDKGIRAYVAPEFCCGLEPLYRLTEGEELRISAVVEAYPSVGVTWYRDGVRLRPSRRAIMTLDRDGQIELALASVTGRDAGVYTCTASNEVGRASTSGKVEIIEGDGRRTTTKRTPPVVINTPDVPYSKEPIFIRKPRSSEAREGDTVIIQCEVIGDPKPDVYWLRDFLKPDYYRDASHFKRVSEGPEYRFEIPHAKLDYTGAYSVVARNVHGEAKAIISLQILAKDPTSSDDSHNVRYGRVEVIPRFERELQDILSYDGDAVEFECRVSGNPEPDIRWFHYNEIIRDCPYFESSFDDGAARLKIKQVTAEDEGTYSCEASNSLGKATSSACLVVYPPGEPNTLSQRLRRPPALLSAASTPRSTPRSTPARSVSRTPGPDTRRLCSPSRQMAPSFYTYPFNKVVEEGDNVTFKCAVKGQPVPWVTWDKDGIIITPSARITMKDKDELLRILEIEQVSIEDVGIYRITVENEYGRAEASARLEVITQKGKFYGGVRAYSPSPRKSLSYRRYPSSSRQD
ncbi:uncharacterized protein LOC142986608 isoform X6 [Anticarsia gemmatalis]|uniref:uncharacterized protein LOC142986608 isoform X6 n=1 Tax=Anticarsia gemmatalis TaxID=129554 RepID=UPI003F777E3F